MAIPKSRHPQSRFVTSSVALLALLLLYSALIKPTVADARELGSALALDTKSAISDVSLGQDIYKDDGVGSASTGAYISDGLGRRAEAGVSALANNAAQNMNIQLGETQYWVFPEAAVNGQHGTTGTGLPGSRLLVRDVGDEESLSPGPRKRDGRQVWISLNTCLQPGANETAGESSAATPPQLQMYISQSESNSKPGPQVDDPDQQTITIEGGYGLFTATADSSVYVGITAPNTTQFSGIWNYEIAASIDAPYHAANTTWPNLYFVDSDNHAALLITNDTTEADSNSTIFQEWMSLSPPYGMFAIPHTSPSLYAVRSSYCGLKNLASISANLESVVNQNTGSMTSRGLGGKPKEQFYLTNLTSSTSYWGVLAMQGNSTASGAGVVGGGGAVWASMNFTTKSQPNCALMYNLTFCSEVAYAVPANPVLFPPLTGGYTQLAALYDSYAANMYNYFNYSLQQIPCNATSTAQFSLVRNCDDCARAYKQWLCAVTIPRCEDFNNTSTYLKPRNLGQDFINGSSISVFPQYAEGGSQHMLLSNVATNSSRNAIIDTEIRPGPYKEVLPCKDLCWDLVQSCPAALGFSCPLARAGLEESYGSRSNDSGVISCSYLGAAYYLSGAGRSGKGQGVDMMGKALVMAGVLALALAV
ncbi:hypothetical protein DV735_g2253, partial [Chaetothyriales sp. CBS 134920]